jgi:ubiquinone/menaquinone biosynthesis C-methylase UbiE
MWNKEKITKMFDKQADRYYLKTKKKNFDDRWRRQLLSYAKGCVLEVCVGAGYNFKFYPCQVNITATDLSARMVEKAKLVAAENGSRAEFIVSAVEDLQLQPQSFDTIVSTLSMCAYEDPGEVLNQFNNWCKPGGIILLMEHGLSKYGFLRWLQRKWSPYHYNKMGCHLDRDMVSIISKSKLKIKKIERKVVGIIILVWAAPSPV